MSRLLIFTWLCLCFLQVASTQNVSDENVDVMPENNSGFGEKRDYNFVNTDIRTAFKAVGAAGGIDVVLSPSVTGKITLNLTQKTWLETLKILSQMANLQYSKEDNYYYVQTMEDLKQAQENAGLERTIIQLKHSKVKDLQQPIEGVLSKRGKLSAVEHTNSLIVVDIPSKIEEILDAVAVLDVETFQVHIQAQIIEVNSNVTSEIGVNWDAGSVDVTTATQPDGSISPSVYSNNKVYGGSTPGSPDPVGASLTFGLLDGRIRMLIQQLLSEGKGEIVAKPQITTLDNRQATIFIGRRFPFLKLDNNLNSVTEFIEAGIQLVCTPHITNDNRIILDLMPRRSDAIIDNVTRGPIVTTQEAKTTVIVNDGQTVVIGGLTSNSEKMVENGLPFLKDLPLLGFLFKYKKKETIKQDLIIFITPRIVRNEGPSGPNLGTLERNQLEDMLTKEGKDGEKRDGLDEENIKNFLDDLGGQ